MMRSTIIAIAALLACAANASAQDSSSAVFPCDTLSPHCGILRNSLIPQGGGVLTSIGTVTNTGVQAHCPDGYTLVIRGYDPACAPTDKLIPPLQ